MQRIGIDEKINDVTYEKINYAELSIREVHKLRTQALYDLCGNLYMQGYGLLELSRAFGINYNTLYAQLRTLGYLPVSKDIRKWLYENWHFKDRADYIREGYININSDNIWKKGVNK